MHKRVPSRGLAPMERRVPKSNKYAHVTATLDTGTTVDKVKYVTAREYSKRRDEIFFRLTKTQLYELYSEYEQDEYETIADTHGGRGNDPRIVTYDEGDSPIYTKPYLILDVREVEEYNQCHLLQARSFPYASLRRDQYHPDIYKFRNKAEHLIILYCNDERVSRDAAKVMVDRGIDNMFVLTGGMAQFAVEFPAFVEGEVPASLLSLVSSPAAKPRSTRLGSIAEDKAYARGADSGSMHSGPRSPESKLTANKLQRHNMTNGSSGGSTSGFSRQSNRDVKSESGTLRSNMSVAESVISRAQSRKGKF